MPCLAQKGTHQCIDIAFFCANRQTRKCNAQVVLFDFLRTNDNLRRIARRFDDVAAAALHLGEQIADKLNVIFCKRTCRLQQSYLSDGSIHPCTCAGCHRSFFAGILRFRESGVPAKSRRSTPQRFSPLPRPPGESSYMSISSRTTPRSSSKSRSLNVECRNISARISTPVLRCLSSVFK